MGIKFKVKRKPELTRFWLAKELERVGCFSIVLECIPKELGECVTQNLKIPTIGIGAGPKTDGQVLVLHDLLGLMKTSLRSF